MRVVSSLRSGVTWLLPSLLFGRQKVLRVIQIVGAIDGRAFFGLLAEAFGFQILDFSLRSIKLLLQLMISLDHIRMTTLPITDIATKLPYFTTELLNLDLQLRNEGQQSRILNGRRF